MAGIMGRVFLSDLRKRGCGKIFRTPRFERGVFFVSKFAMKIPTGFKRIAMVIITARVRSAFITFVSFAQLVLINWSKNIFAWNVKWMNMDQILFEKIQWMFLKNNNRSYIVWSCSSGWNSGKNEYTIKVYFFNKVVLSIYFIYVYTFWIFNFVL